MNSFSDWLIVILIAAIITILGHTAYNDITTTKVYDFLCVEDTTKETADFVGVSRIDINPSSKDYTWYPEPIQESIRFNRCVITKSYRVKDD